MIETNVPPEGFSSLEGALEVLRQSPYNSDAWNRVMKELRPFLVRYCRTVLRQYEDAAEDVSQTVLLQLYEHPRFSELAASSDALRAFVVRVATHRSIDELRRQARRREEPLDSVEAQKVAVSAGSPLMGISTVDELVQRLESVGARLGDADIQLLRGVVAKTPLGEIAEVLEISRPAVAVRLHRLRVKLRKLLQEYEI